MKRDPYFWLTVIMISFMSIMALEELWEQDIFWQIRAGNELLTTWSFPYLESWSYTSAGEPWYNFQWIATIIIAIVHRVAGIPGLVMFRMMLYLAVLFTIAATLARRLRTPDKWPVIFVTLAMIAVAISFRTQMRPDFMMLIPFALIGLVWSLSLGLSRKCLLSLFLILVAANIHPGTAVFAVGYAMLSAWTPLSTMSRRMLFFASNIATWCMTPYLWQMPWYLKRHIFYTSSTFFVNPDHAPLAFSDFTITTHGLYSWAFLLCTILATAAFIRMITQCRSRGFTSYDIVAGITLLAFTAMTINRQRTIPYTAIIMAPFIADFLLQLWQKRQLVLRIVYIAGATLLILGHGITNKHPLGLRLNNYLYPTECIQFIQKHQPMAQLFHINRWGDIILDFLPNYKVATDSREMPFDKMGPSFVKIYNQPKLMADFINRYQIHSIMLPLDFFTLTMHSGDLPWSRRSAFFPNTEWAVVAYDNNGMLLIQRIPQHASLIARYEFRLAIPDVPPDFYLRYQGRTTTSDAQFHSEVERCLKELPEADYCALLEARWIRRDGTIHGRQMAREFIQRRLAIDPKKTSVYDELELIDKEGVVP